MLEKIAKWIEEAIKKLNYPADQFAGRWGVEHPDELARGDYATNVALVLAKVVNQEPLVLAKKIADQLKASPLEFSKARPWLDRVEVVPPGFINFFLTRDFFTGELKQVLEQGDKYGRVKKIGAGEKVMVEYTDPNPFKEFHIGHLMSNAVGESVSRLIESQGAEVKRACYQGDVGMHVAKAVWGLINKKENPYAVGSQAYETDERAKREINDLNKKIYERSDETVNKIYDAGRQASLDAFEIIYKRLGTKFDYYFFESESGPVGQKLVEEHLDARLPKGSQASTVSVFEKSDGAVVFKGEKYSADLHTRVFLNSEGLPTYEAKELGLAKLKYEKYPYDQSVVITGNEVVGYFAVLMKALKLISPDLAKKTKHISHGMLRLPSGKMSSRTGDVVTAETLLGEVREKIKQKMVERALPPAEMETVAEGVTIAAVKYSILKQSPGRDIIFDVAKSLSLEGDSGPYLQYAYVRALAVLEKARAENISPNLDHSIEISELEKLLVRFPEIVTRATVLYAPNLLITYLTELASAFNSYYATQKIVDALDHHSPYRLALTATFTQIMKSGLTLLAIPVLEKM